MPVATRQQICGHPGRECTASKYHGEGRLLVGSCMQGTISILRVTCSNGRVAGMANERLLGFVGGRGGGLSSSCRRFGGLKKVIVVTAAHVNEG